MTDIMGTVVVVLELIWTLIKVHAENLRCIYKVFVPDEPKNVQGEIALITGAGHGIGRELAQRFAKLGAIVVCVDINAKGNEETVQAIKDNGGKAYKYECDVSNRTAVFSLADKVAKEVGEVTILVNNAGIMPCQPFLKWTEQNISSTLNVNVAGNLWTLQAFLPAMKKRNHGHIVALSSMAGHIGTSYLVPYCGSKFAIRGIMEALENELYEETDGKSNIKFTTICPYTVDTGLAKNPRIRFQKANKMVDAGEAADLIVDAVRRNQWTITIPVNFFYVDKFFTRFLAPSAVRILHKFIGAGVNPHD
ncbi:17-beta-hydroxysteroid dehydrogenase 13-like [Cydia pomonella]|uniref:17-beta-hydroxysteroid dehydrogenase 13-like n=1 Tax=Cydia pomonella TaxID=82600 RepID=UPI002ADE4487|nr:17-beta-hydroxysteroid dehydrogenase 13-like [Cydia pomonella]